MEETLSSRYISPGLQQIAELARRNPQWTFTTLAHHIDLKLLTEAYRRTRKDGAVGVDGQTAAAYAVNLEANLQSLLDRMHTGSYHAPPVRRTYIPKADGRMMRPIGIPTFEDKVLQRAVAMVLEAIYESDFLGCSYGFRPGRSAHQALQALWQGMIVMKGGWLVEVDIQSFFDELDHSQLRGFLDQRVRDGVIRRLVHKWLKAGVLEQGEIRRPETGTPQGGVISPLLANIYLHEVMDVWFEQEVKPRLGGPSFLVRYADDFVLVLERERDARRVMDVLPKRFGKFGLKLHPDKTRVVRFVRPSQRRAGDTQVPSRSNSFDFLGFTHYWGKSWRGGWVIKRRTAKSRFTRAVKGVRGWCRTNRHLPLAVQHGMLVRKLRGHFNYYGITGNYEALARFQWEVRRTWHKWLGRRSQRGRIPWDDYERLLRRYPLPSPRVVHSTSRPLAKPVV
ncbi:MAG: group II intron reverse transcriptase/maturase [SAR202 cluster bacterium]|nr:group II intron reverse transcriptase/maturase [SAR202 cluster bacterium]